MLTPVFRATTPSALGKVTWLSHDCWFDLDQIAWDVSTARVDLPFGRGRERDRRLLGLAFTTGAPPGHYDCRLSIRNANSLTIDDDASLGIYDLTTIRYDEEQGAVVITSSLSAGTLISISTDQIDVEVATLDKPHSGEGGLSQLVHGRRRLASRARRRVITR